MAVQLSSSLPTSVSNPAYVCGCPACTASRAAIEASNSQASGSSKTNDFSLDTTNVITLPDPVSDKYYVNALIWPGTPRWNPGSPLRTPVTLSYAFMTSVPDYYTVTNGTINFPNSTTGIGFSAISDALRQQQIRVALSRWSDVANITFVQTASDFGQIRFGMTDLTGNAVGMAFPPAPDYGIARGDVWLDNQPGSRNDSFALGTFGFQTVFHELGHTLGLKHPFDARGVTLSGAENSYTLAGSRLYFTKG